jgi:hypothetical protein
MGPDPTFWQWIGFWAMMTVLFGGLISLGIGRLPEWARAGLLVLLRPIPGLLVELLRRISLALDWLGGFVLWAISLGALPLIDERHPRQRTQPVNSSHHLGNRYVTYHAPAAPPAGNENDVAQPDRGVGNAIAITGNGGNEDLPGNGITRAQADIIARLIKSKTLYIPDGKGGFKEAGQVALIRLATGLEPSGRPDSAYSKLKAELDPLLPRTLTISGGRPDERVIVE